MSDTHPEKCKIQMTCVREASQRRETKSVLHIVPSINGSNSDTLSANFQDKEIAEIESSNEEVASNDTTAYNYKDDPDNPMVSSNSLICDLQLISLLVVYGIELAQGQENNPTACCVNEFFHGLLFLCSLCK